MFVDDEKYSHTSLCYFRTKRIAEKYSETLALQCLEKHRQKIVCPEIANGEIKVEPEDCDERLSETLCEDKAEFTCCVCPLVFKSQEYLDSHIKKKHPNGGKYEVK